MTLSPRQGERVWLDESSCLVPACSANGDIGKSSIIGAETFVCETPLLGFVRGGEKYPQVFEGVCEGLGEGEGHCGICPLKFPLVQEVRSAIWGTTQDLSPIVDAVLP